MKKAKKKSLSNQVLVETGAAELRKANILRVDVEDWAVLLELQEKVKPSASVEHCDGFILVHFDFPSGPLGEYQISVQQPFIDICRSWVGKFHAWVGLELASIALSFSFETSSNSSLPVLCNYNREGVNRGVIGMLDHVPSTKINQRPVFDPPPMNLLQTQFIRTRISGGFRETVVIYRAKSQFADAVRNFMRFCRKRQGIEPMPAPEWAREPVWCSWYSHLYMLTQAEVEEQIPHLKKMGIGTIVIDASWFQSKNTDTGATWESGDYRMNKTFFPDFRGLARRVHADGMKIMLWCAPLFVGELAKKRKLMEPYCTWDGTTRSQILCPFCEESKAHARELAERVMRDYDLDGLKLDFMDQLDTPCVDPEHDHGDRNHGAAMVEFMRALRDGVLKANPDAAIEYRVSYSNLASLPFANCHRGNDAPYDADYMRRENSFLRLYCNYPSAVWSDYAYWHTQEKPDNISQMLGGQIFSGGVPTLSIDFTKRTEKERKIVGRWMKFYRQHCDTLAKAELTVHSADSIISVSSLQNLEKGVAFVLIAGQHIPVQIKLKPKIRQVWILNTSAEKDGHLELISGKFSVRAKITGREVLRVDLL